MTPHSGQELNVRGTMFIKIVLLRPKFDKLRIIIIKKNREVPFLFFFAYMQTNHIFLSTTSVSVESHNLNKMYFTAMYA